MLRVHQGRLIGFLGVVGVAGLLGGCDALSFITGAIPGDEGFVAVDVSEIGGADGLSAKAGVVESEPATVTMPDDVLAEAPDDVTLALRADGIAVVVDGDAAGRRSPAAKGQERHASIGFRMAERDLDACEALETIGPFELTIIDGVVTLERESFPLNTRARSLVRSGRFELCAETEADFDGSITLGGVSFEFGRLPSNEERVVLCHIPPEEEGDAHTITVGSSSVDAHLAHGDYLGDCENQDDATDTDGDGVSDGTDACPETLTGETVEANGCSCAQRDADSDGVNDCDDRCAQTPVGDAVGVDGCALVTIDANAGPDIATIVGVSIDVVAAATVLTGDYDEAALTFVWEQVSGDAVTLEANGSSFRVDTTGTAGTIVLRVTASTADGSAADSDDFTITIDSDAIQVDSANCDPATGHCYILARKSDGSNDQLWWDDAKVKANKMVHNGMRGHLPTITSIEERRFLAGVASNTPAMLGGTDRDEEGVWVWADGPESGQLIEYLPWAASEPNDLYHWTYPEGEDYLQHEARGFNDINGGRWYYVEFEPGWD